MEAELMSVWVCDGSFFLSSSIGTVPQCRRAQRRSGAWVSPPLPEAAHRSSEVEPATSRFSLFPFFAFHMPSSGRPSGEIPEAHLDTGASPRCWSPSWSSACPLSFLSVSVAARRSGRTAPADPRPRSTRFASFPLLPPGALERGSSGRN